MSFELPDLDTRDRAALQAELIRRIPQYTRLWTDYNDSDPGITFLQMLCWIGESLLYQANAIPNETQQNFLREVLGLAYTTNSTPYSEAADADCDFAFQRLRAVLGQVETGAALDRAQLQNAVLEYLDNPYLALSLSDVETLARETNQMIAYKNMQHASSSAPLLVKRADAKARDEAISVYVLSDAHWAYQYPPYPNSEATDARGGMSRVLILQKPSGSAAQEADKAERTLLENVRAYLAPRVLLGNRVNVAPAQLTEINLSVAVRCPPQVQLDFVLDTLLATLFAYFKPDQIWAYDQPPAIDRLQWIIETVPGVAALERIELNYAPTVRLPSYARLGVNCLLADLPPGPPAMLYRGLPQLRCLELYARNAQ
ncbi:hypothetical protein B1992_00090 [Pseudoxanthomonas broegbernensis]|uniref:Baseplate protein J-like domain-containing protein n=1 Tax=Pseudoxanthomonas broegbernensis TaxID=83619 RepID=A0A7V8K838_9GAMM|nr:hypothetical protein [Pseudoxanthomonas broegbernensis]KAF1687890.1 hypothetical protein B1992_00090 [Pseudoxanthomonas broegbernensis]MBB6064881.1 hypothetical protein [Pseudoxanthomonas broegbernensis]